MMKSNARRFAFVAAVAVLGMLFAGGCSKDLMSPDEQAPTGSSITNPVHLSSLNERVINVRGRAEVGATVDIFVNDVMMGSDQALVAIDAGDMDTSLGLFTVADIDLGDEGTKVIRARITDLYGNVSLAADTPTITVRLDQTAPPVAFEDISGTIDPEWIDDPGYWGPGYYKTGLPRVTIAGTTDTTAAGARLRYGINEFEPSEYVEEPGTGVLSYDIVASSPSLSAGNTDTILIYSLEAYDDAGNVSTVPVVVRWEVQGQEEELLHDDGVYNSYDHTVTGFPDQRMAVRFQAPTWANYVVAIKYYIANDQISHPVDPQLPTTEEFTAFVWRVTAGDSLPGAAGNAGYLQLGGYPEDEWVEVRLPNAVEITNNSHYPDKKFYAGLQWDVRLNPYIYEDHSDPIDYKSFRYNWSTWELRTQADTMIRAIVSDVPGGALLGGRERSIAPEAIERKRL